MQQLLALGMTLLVSSASAFQLQSPMTQPQQGSYHRQQPLAATPTNNIDSDTSNTNNNNPLHNRRNMLGLAVTNLAFLSSYASSANAAVLRSAGCVYGEGEACADLAEGNEFIQNLQKKSAQNKEVNQRVRREFCLVIGVSTFAFLSLYMSHKHYCSMTTQCK